MADLKGVIFDADGTLLDTREFIFQAYEHVLSTSGYPVPERSFMATYIGTSLANCYKAFAPRGDVDQLCRVHDIFQENNMQLVDSYEGLVDTLDTLRQGGLKLGICSSRGKNLLPTLERVGIKEHCDVVIHADLVSNHKPHPEGILKALETLSLEPQQAAMVGDTAVDIETGKRAGVLFTVGVTHGFGMRESLEAAGADHIVDRLPDIIPLFLPTT